MNQIRKRLTYANVMSSIAVFLVLGGATAFAASQLGKNSVGTKQLKKNAVTAAKIKKNAVTAAKIRRNAVTNAKIGDNAVTTAKIADGAVSGAKVNAATLGTVPNSVATEEVKGSKGVLALGQQATMFEHGPLKLIVSCEPYEATAITARTYIESSTPGTTLVSWMDESSAIGPDTPLIEREVTSPGWASSGGPLSGEAGAPVTANAANGNSFAGSIGVASEKNSGTCWYWFNGTILG